MKKELKIGLDFAAPIPLHTDYASGKFEGFEVDLMKAIADELQLEVKYSVSLWKDILQQLQNGEIDAVCSAATVTPEREKELGFSKPYLNFRLCVVCNENNIVSIEDLENKKLGVRIATEAEKYIKENFKKNKPVTFDTNEKQYEQLTNGKVDAVIDDASIAGGFAGNNARLVVSYIIPGTDSQYAIALKKDNTDLKRQIDNIIDQLSANGFLKNNTEKWFQGIEL